MASFPDFDRHRKDPPALGILLSVMLAAGCASLPQVETVVAADPQDCVVLLHGVNRSFRAMRPMAEQLRRDGFTTVLAHMVPRYALLAHGLAQYARSVGEVHVPYTGLLLGNSRRECHIVPLWQRNSSGCD